MIFFCVGVAQLAEHWASIPKVVGSIPTVVRHIFQACPVWIYTQSNKTNIDNMHQGYHPKVNTNVKKLALLFAIQHLLHHSIVYNIYTH